LFVRELVLGALEGLRLVHQRGVWRLVGPLVTTARLHELLATRLGTLGTSATDALDVVAVWEPTGLSMLEEVLGADQLELLDRSARQLVIRRRHPLGVRHDGSRHRCLRRILS
jgi:hypothetical protein